VSQSNRELLVGHEGIIRHHTGRDRKTLVEGNGPECDQEGEGNSDKDEGEREADIVANAGRH
jgi:hypothetical protein